MCELDGFYGTMLTFDGPKSLSQDMLSDLAEHWKPSRGCSLDSKSTLNNDKHECFYEGLKRFYISNRHSTTSLKREAIMRSCSERPEKLRLHMVIIPAVTLTLKNNPPPHPKNMCSLNTGVQETASSQRKHRW